MSQETRNILSDISAWGTAAAALFSAVSAWASARSATAAKAMVEEARKARESTLAPRIVMEQCFDELYFVWPHPLGQNGGPGFLSQKHRKDRTCPIPPLFSIQNFGQSPALEVTIDFELEDDNHDLSVPEEWRMKGISKSSGLSGKDMERIPTLTYTCRDGQSASHPLYRRQSCQLPHLSPGLPRDVELPVGIANRLFLRALQRWPLRGKIRCEDLSLWARIKCCSVDGKLHETAFRWAVNPFSQGQVEPVIVYGHCRAIPLRVDTAEKTI